MANRLKNLNVLRTEKNKRYFEQTKFPEIPVDNSDLYIVTKDGDRLDLIADAFYNDTSLWWVIVQANPNTLKGDSIALKPGIQIRIPTTPEIIIRNFDKINK